MAKKEPTTTGIQSAFNMKNKQIHGHKMLTNDYQTLMIIVTFIFCQCFTAPPYKAESVILPQCLWTLAAPRPAALPHTASSGPSDTYAGCQGLVWSFWQSAGDGWPGGIQLSASLFPDHCDV